MSSLLQPDVPFNDYGVQPKFPINSYSENNGQPVISLYDRGYVPPVSQPAPQPPHFFVPSQPTPQVPKVFSCNCLFLQMILLGYFMFNFFLF